MFKLSELVKWLGLTEFEIFTNLLALLTFTILLSLRIASYLQEQVLDWFGIFSPLFCADLCNGYFCIIIGIRMYLDTDQIKRRALHRILWSANFLILTLVFKYLLCLKLSGQTGLEFSEVFSPIFILLQLIAVRACQLPTSG